MQSPLLNCSQLESFAVLGYDDYLDLLSDVIHDIPGHLDGIQAGIQAEDSAAVSTRVHSFRGMISYFGCIALTDRLSAIEHQPAIAADQAAVVHAELQDLWDRSLAAIKLWEKSVPDFAPE